jgi:2-polyprenyl-3-methyl-5-hydroxy-6-metoxy-1,4-benzoquinol methylase
MSDELPMMDLRELAEGLTERAPGLWASSRTADVFYPGLFNEWCALLEENSFWFKHRNRCIVEIVKHFPPPGPIFDVGGGNGYVSIGLQKAGFEVVLIEPNIQGIQCARSRGLPSVIHSTVEDAQFKPASVPAFGGFDLLEHIKDDVEYLEYLKSLLVENGRIYLTVPAFNLLWSLEDDISEHMRRYTLPRLVSKLKSVGFTIDFASYFFWWLPLPIFLFRTIPSKFKRNQMINLEELENQHQMPQGFSKKIIDYLLDIEFKRFQKKQPAPFGGSCLIAATSGK